jgi:elongation factor G
MAVQVITPPEFLGDVTGDLSAKRGAIEAMTDRGQVKVIDAKVPLAEMFGYATKLRSITQGRGSFTMQADHYAEVPPQIAQLIIEGKK